MIYLAAAACVLVGLLVFLAWPAPKSLGEEKAELLDYFKARDAADARGERYPK